MCGIVGFTGTQQAAPILLDGLSKLEYRGYDLAGIAAVSYTHLMVPHIRVTTSEMSILELIELMILNI